MSAEIVNLRRLRKARARRENTEKAAENRAAFGRTRAERGASDRLREQAENRLDGHRLQTGDETSR